MKLRKGIVALLALLIMTLFAASSCVFPDVDRTHRRHFNHFIFIFGQHNKHHNEKGKKGHQEWGKKAPSKKKGKGDSPKKPKKGGKKSPPKGKGKGPGKGHH